MANRRATAAGPGAGTAAAAAGWPISADQQVREAGGGSVDTRPGADDCGDPRRRRPTDPASSPVSGAGYSLTAETNMAASRAAPAGRLLLSCRPRPGRGCRAGKWGDTL